MKIRVATGMLALLLASAARAVVPEPGRVNALAERVDSTEGFSLLQPQGVAWSVTYGDELRYDRHTDRSQVAFFMASTDGKLPAPLESEAALLAHVREQKRQWLEGGRYELIRSAFSIDPEAANCVAYDLSVRDRHATDKGRHDYLVLASHGRFCVHPQAPTSMIDVYYHLRHAPSFETGELVAEGNRFLQSLVFEPR